MWPSFLFPFSCHPAQSISFSSSLPPPLSSPPTYFWPLFCSHSYFHFVLPFFPLHLVSFIHPLWPSYLFSFHIFCLVSLCTRSYLYCYLYLFMPCTLCSFLPYFHTSLFLSHIINYPFRRGVPFIYRPLLLILLTCPSASFVVI